MLFLKLLRFLQRLLLNLRLLQLLVGLLQLFIRFSGTILRLSQLRLESFTSLRRSLRLCFHLLNLLLLHRPSFLISLKPVEEEG